MPTMLTCLLRCTACPKAFRLSAKMVNTSMLFHSSSASNIILSITGLLWRMSMATTTVLIKPAFAPGCQVGNPGYSGNWGDIDMKKTKPYKHVKIGRKRETYTHRLTFDNFTDATNIAFPSPSFDGITLIQSELKSMQLPYVDHVITIHIYTVSYVYIMCQ